MTQKKLAFHLSGHGNELTELSNHPTDSSSIVSTSKDESARLWSLKTRHCIAIFAGDNGHRADVLSADIHLSGSKMLTCGMDNNVKLWDLNAPS